MSENKSLKKAAGREKLPTALHEWDLNMAQQHVSEGLPISLLNDIQKRMRLSNAEFAEVIRISPRTLARRRKEERLPPEESERLFRVGRLFDLAADLFRDDDDANRWFRESSYPLGNQIPIEIVNTEPGAKLVERVLRHIEWGIPV